MEILQDIANAVKVLRGGGLILYPTDTIWGIGCDATNLEAVKRLFSLKKRPGAKAMISLVDSISTLTKWVEFIPENAKAEIRNNPGLPLTIIYDSPHGIAIPLLAEDKSAAFRITEHYFSKKLCSGLGKPIVSTSSNFSGDNPAGSFREIKEDIINGVDYVCQSERDKNSNSPSRILKITNDELKTIIRD